MSEYSSRGEDQYAFEVGSLYAEFEKLQDWRDPRGVRYPIAALLSMMVLAKLASEDRPCGIAHWVALRADKL